jgi:hypothetical protein
MDRQSQRIVLENIRSQVGNRWPQLVNELRSMGDHDLPSFLSESLVDLSDVIRAGRSWTELRRAAQLPTRPGADRETELLKRVRAVVHVDDPERHRTYSKLLADDAQSYGDLGSGEQRLAWMLFISLWPSGGGHASITEGLASLQREESVRDELTSVLDLAFASASHVPIALDGPLHHVPLQVHGRYRREEVLAALDYASLDRKPNSFREGVLYVPEIDVDAFFVTLRKSEADYSPTTLYRDYPISQDLFHWESQSTTSETSATGRRYISGSSTKLLFVRHAKSDEFGTSPYLFAGPATYVHHVGERPIAFTWRLQHKLPNEFFTEASVAAN